MERIEFEFTKPTNYRSGEVEKSRARLSRSKFDEKFAKSLWYGKYLLKSHNIVFLYFEALTKLKEKIAKLQ